MTDEASSKLCKRLDFCPAVPSDSTIIAVEVSQGVFRREDEDPTIAQPMHTCILSTELAQLIHQLADARAALAARPLPPIPAEACDAAVQCKVADSLPPTPGARTEEEEAGAKELEINPERLRALVSRLLDAAGVSWDRWRDAFLGDSSPQWFAAAVSGWPASPAAGGAVGTLGVLGWVACMWAGRGWRGRWITKAQVRSHGRVSELELRTKKGVGGCGVTGCAMGVTGCPIAVTEETVTLQAILALLLATAAILLLAARRDFRRRLAFAGRRYPPILPPPPPLAQRRSGSQPGMCPPPPGPLPQTAADKLLSGCRQTPPPAVPPPAVEAALRLLSIAAVAASRAAGTVGWRRAWRAAVASGRIAVALNR